MALESGLHLSRDSGSHYDYEYTDDGASTSSQAYSGYGEEDHRRLVFGLMRGGYNSKVALALRYIGEDGSSVASGTDDDDGSDDDDINSVDDRISNNYEDEDDEEEDLPEEVEESPALTSRPLSYGIKRLSLADHAETGAGAIPPSEDNNDERLRGGGGGSGAWVWAKNDDQQKSATLNHLRHRDEGYVHKWVADQRVGVAEVV